jgi:CP family cyanate transporter-like MFS transporter
MGFRIARRRPGVRSLLVMAGVLLIGANLRAAITSVGPVLAEIRQDTGMGGAVASLLVSLPLVGFALVSPVAPALARRFGLERSLAGSLVVLMLAIVARSLPLTGAIWVGTVFLGAAVAVLNVLLPALIKREYPARIGAFTGLYSAVQTGVAAVAAGLAVPLSSTAGGWRFALGVWAGLALIGVAVFLPQLSARFAAEAPSVVPAVFETAKGVSAQDAAAAVPPVARLRGSMWRSLLAWQVTLFLGLQSTVFYVVITWWPSIEREDGVPAVVAGFHQFVLQATGIAGTLAAGALLQRLRDQRGLAAVLSLFSLTAVIGQMVLPVFAVAWVTLLGIAAGGSIVVGLSLFGLRTRNHMQAAALSGMAQSVGYLIAACGPVSLGLMHDVLGSWRLPLVILAAVCVAPLVFAILAGQDRYVEAGALTRRSEPRQIV